MGQEYTFGIRKPLLSQWHTYSWLIQLKKIQIGNKMSL